MRAASAPRSIAAAIAFVADFHIVLSPLGGLLGAIDSTAEIARANKGETRRSRKKEAPRRAPLVVIAAARLAASRAQTTPWPIIASATLTKPAMLAPAT